MRSSFVIWYSAEDPLGSVDGFGWIPIAILLLHFCAELAQGCEEPMIISEKNVLWHTVNSEQLWPFFALSQSKNFTHFFVSVFISLGTKPHCNSSKSSSCMLKSNRLPSSRLFSLTCERLEDLALRRFTAANWNYRHIFWATNFGKPLTTCFANAIHHWKRVVTSMYSTFSSMRNTVVQANECKSVIFKLEYWDILL